MQKIRAQLPMPSADPLPFRTEDVKRFVDQFEKYHPEVLHKNKLPTDPQKAEKGALRRIFGSSNQEDSLPSCIENCRYALFRAANKEAGTEAVGPESALTSTQREVHARFASMQTRCFDMCKESHFSSG